MRRLHGQALEFWGEPDDVFVFDRGSSQSASTRLKAVSVLVWLPGESCDVTSFNTVGMSEERMAGAPYRTELNLGYRGSLPPEACADLAAFLANMAEYPFANQLKLDWWERLSNPGPIPHFPSFAHLVLAPSLNGRGLEWFDAPDDDVKLLRVIPITSHENVLLRDRGVAPFLEYAAEAGVDLFSAFRGQRPLAGS